MFPLNTSTASDFTHATTLFALDLADLYSALSFSNPDCFHYFSRSFFSSTAFSSSTFQHQLSSHHIVQFRLICHTLPRYFPPIYQAAAFHHLSTVSSNVSSSSDSSPLHLFLQKASITLTSFEFHHFINFLPIDFIFSLHAFSPSVARPTIYWWRKCKEKIKSIGRKLIKLIQLTTASDGIMWAYLIDFVFPSMLFPSHKFHVIYLVVFPHHCYML